MASNDAITQKLLFDLPQIRTQLGLVFGSGVFTALVAAKAGEAYNQKRIGRIIVSGGVRREDMDFLTQFLPVVKQLGLPEPKDHETEGDYAARILMDKFNVPASDIAIDNTALNTAQNIETSLPLGLNNARSVTLFTLALSQYRALATLRQYKSLKDITATTTPVYPIPGVHKATWPAHPLVAKLMRDEYAKHDEYAAKGFFKDIDIERERLVVVNLEERQKMIARGYSEFAL